MYLKDSMKYNETETADRNMKKTNREKKSYENEGKRKSAYVV